MDCTAARHAMLEAEAEELAGRSGSELSRHVAACDACRAAAAEILAAERGLAEWLRAAGPTDDASSALARARATAQRRARRRRVAAGASALAAAALAAVVLIPRGRAPLPPLAVAPAAPGFTVTAPPGRDVIVMHTSNPKIVVVWYQPSRRS